MPLLAEFVVRENGTHHDGSSISEDLFARNVQDVYREDLSLFDSSAFYLAYAGAEVVGSLKVTHWDRFATLPLEKLFGINGNHLPIGNKNVAVWHIGRLAISKERNPIGIGLLKQLLTLAIYSICQHPQESVMVAECDRKLMRVLNLIGIKTRALGPGIEYLGSETIPIYATDEWLRVFLEGNELVEKLRLTAADTNASPLRHLDPARAIA